MASHVSGYIGKINPGNGTNYAIGSTAYGVCDTAANTAAKTVDMTGFTLVTGATVHIKFTYGNSATNPTLNINGTGAKSMVQYGTTPVPSSMAWYANSVVSLTYDGTYWVRDYGVATTEYADGYFLVFNTSFSFSADNTYADYPYRAAYANGDINSGMYAEVVFSLNDANSGNYAPICETYNGGMYIYSKINTTITVPTIIVFYENGVFSQVLDKNFVYINSVAPTDVSLVWIDTAHNNIAKVYNGSEWITISGAFA